MNYSEKTISGIRAELVLPSDFETDSNAFALQELAPKQKIENQEFLFSSKELVQGKRRIALLVSFTDENGVHMLDKATIVEVKSPDLSILLVAAAIALILASVLVFGKKGKAKPVSKKAEPQKTEPEKTAEKRPEPAP